MRAAIIDRFGGPEEFHVVDDRPTPRPRAGEVLVRVLAAGVNPLDYKIRDGSSGLAKNLQASDFPLVLGRECCGEVSELGEGVTDLAVGRRVYGMPALTHPAGCYAEYAALPADALAPASEAVETTVLAGTALAGLTAWSAVHDLAKVGPDDVVLVHGGGGGVGQLVVQLAVATGATVYATASARHHDLIESWGATHVDYATQDFREVTPTPTVVIDGVYFGTFEPSLDHLAPGGRIVALPSLADLEPARARGFEASIPQITPDRARLTALADRLADGRLHVQVSQVLPLEDVARAHEIVEGGHAQGKVVLDVAAAQHG